MSFWDRPMTEGEIQFCVMGFFVLSELLILRVLYETFGPKRIRVPRLYWDPPTREWRTDGSQEMVQLAMECAKVGDVVTLAPGKHKWKSKPASLTRV